MELMDTPEADAATPRFIAPHPNTYTFTKCIAEALVQKECVDIPTSIVRPAIARLLVFIHGFCH
jgi:fatty acyl-CoA reductase